jgi:dTDP-4-dehydrorhamnose reductase
MELTYMSKNVLVTGASGQLGSELKSITQESNFFFTDRNILDISDKSAILNFCTVNNIEIIINCAAYTAVDKAEDDVQNADKINHLATLYLAQIAKEKEISLVHVSTDYVFDGKNYKPYNEDDKVSPNGVYGQTKLDGENAMIKINPLNSIIIRTSWVYSSFGANFVKTMLRLGNDRDELGVIFDQVGTPTYARDLAAAILNILPQLNNTAVEIYHYSNEGVCSWYDFAKTIFELSETDCKTNPIETFEYPTPATRPHYSLLNKSKIKKQFNLEIPYWKDSLKDCLKTLKDNA